MTVDSYAFVDSDAPTAAGVRVRIPAGVHPVEQRSLVFRVRLGGREVDLTLAEFDRLRSTGLVKVVSGPAATS
jgi:predicted thioesterase